MTEQDEAVRLAQAIETEWYNGNMSEDTMDRILATPPPAAPALDVDLMKRIVQNGVPPDALMSERIAGESGLNLRRWWLEQWAPVLQEVRARLTGQQEDGDASK